MYRIELDGNQLKALKKTLALLDGIPFLSSPESKAVLRQVTAAYKRMLKGEK